APAGARTRRGRPRRAGRRAAPAVPGRRLPHPDRRRQHPWEGRLMTVTMPGALPRAAADTSTSALRVLLAYRHSPGLLAASLAVPVVMVVVFGYVFGSAMQVPGGGGYREFLMPGLFVMVAVNGLMPTMVG